MKIFFHTLGCKVNQYETQEMREEAEKNGYMLTEHEDEADIFVINSCTVTGESDRKTRQCVRHFKAAGQLSPPYTHQSKIQLSFQLLTFQFAETRSQSEYQSLQL